MHRCDAADCRPKLWHVQSVSCYWLALYSDTYLALIVGARALIGFGTAFVQLASPLLITETAYPSQRPAMSSLFNTMWFSGAIVAAWSTFGTFHIHNSWSWRIPSVLQALPSILQLMFIWFIPESPRYLIRKGQDEKALAILTKYHADGNRDDPLIEFEYNEIKEAIAIEELYKKSTSYLQLFNTRANLRRMRIIIGTCGHSHSICHTL